MRNPVERARALEPIQRRVLEAALSLGLGPWASSRALADLVNRFDEQRHDAVERAVCELLDDDILEADDDLINLTRFGYNVADAAGGMQNAERDADLAPLPVKPPEDFPWPDEIENPDNVPWEYEPSFRDDLKVAEGDAGLREKLLTSMKAVLADPTRYGDWMRDDWSGCKGCRVGHNFRLYWRPATQGVEFLLFCKKTDNRCPKTGD